jgi:effector-binding domain-containing protein
MTAPKPSSLKLSRQAEPVVWPETHYVFLEKIGPFQDTAARAWEELTRLVPQLSQNHRITGFMSLYKVGPKIYRAGVSLAAEPADLPAALKYFRFKGGNYVRFVLTGPYANLPEASGRVFEMVAEQKIPLRDDFYIENYVNDPKTTPEDQLITEILVPTA